MWSVSINRHQAEHTFHFQDLLQLQNELLSELGNWGGRALLFAELAPTITLGARQMQAGEGMKTFSASSATVVAGERGGNETWHGPGQWTCFVLAPLQAFTGDSKGVRKAVYQILDAVLVLAQEYLPDAHLREGPELGIWTQEGKLASVGIKIRDGYLTSGFALNCLPCPESFLGVSPCGLAAKPDFLLKNIKHSAVAEDTFQRLPLKIADVFRRKFP